MMEAKNKVLSGELPEDELHIALTEVIKRSTDATLGVEFDYKAMFKVENSKF